MIARFRDMSEVLLIVRSREPSLGGARAAARFAHHQASISVHTEMGVRLSAHLTNSHCDTICSPLAECKLSR
jgi:hypothetical protein